jgi:hypothetical protein
MTAIEIQQDEIYAEAFKKAEKAFNKKYDRLKFAAERFIKDYDSTYGAPDEWESYFDLLKILEPNG